MRFPETVPSLHPSPRACLAGVAPYRPGKPIGEVQRELGLRRVVKLASNENPQGASPRALKVLRRDCREAYRYPEGASPLLRCALAAEHRLRPEWVAVGSGSDGLIRLLCEAFLEPAEEVIVSEYGFIRFSQNARLMGASVVSVPMRNWTHDLEAMAERVTSHTKLLFIASPNNPTGTYNTQQQLEGLLAKVSSRVAVVLDEAYCHYAVRYPRYHRSLPDLVLRFPNLVVLRTFSKAYGLAGLRVGYAVAQPHIVRHLDQVRLPFNVGVLSQRAALEALKDRAFVRKGVEGVEKGKRFLFEGLRALGSEVLESAANFLFVRVPCPARKIFEALLRKGIIVRPMAEYGLEYHLRISVGLPFENRALLKAMRDVLGKAKKTDHRH